jgi:hypothetical protein
VRKPGAALTIAFLALAAVCAAASDPWKSKPYDKWTKKEVEKILNNSPWAQVVRVPYHPSLGGERVEQQQKIQIGKTVWDPANDSEPNAVKDTFEPDSTFVVRWNSALTIRRALFRDALLRGVPKNEAARRYLEQRADEFELVLVPVGQTFLPPTEPSTLLRNTYLELQPSGEKLIPIRAQARREVDASRREGYAFQFRRLLADGTPAIPQGVVRIDFFTQVGPRMFRARFQLDKMFAPEDLDLY